MKFSLLIIISSCFNQLNNVIAVDDIEHSNNIINNEALNIKHQHIYDGGKESRE